MAWKNIDTIVYFPAFFPSSSSYFFSVCINKSGFTDCVFSWKWSNGISWTVRDTHQMYFVWIVFYIEMEMWCIHFVFFFFSFKWESIASLFTSINNKTQKITRNRMQFTCLQLQSQIGLIKNFTKTNKRIESNIEWNVLTTEIISTCPASCQKLYTLKMLTRSKGTRTEWSKTTNKSSVSKQDERTEKNEIQATKKKSHRYVKNARSLTQTTTSGKHLLNVFLLLNVLGNYCSSFVIIGVSV